ncbi:hypothetical protein F2P81_024415 [Scophthalmus maximus]|uniref:Uncharacterized protein n=1 Tax=Scophthalmus maximus TaxID=52904 RepID=A0A6A4RU70_SCOMX|nr:hypothetical protein F2P81_024415 [Scophthalmus maximus]
MGCVQTNKRGGNPSAVVTHKSRWPLRSGDIPVCPVTTTQFKKPSVPPFPAAAAALLKTDGRRTRGGGVNRSDG